MRFISWGRTRFVIFAGDSAVKIARVRPISLVFRLLFLMFQPHRKLVQFREKYGFFPGCLWNYLIAGFIANRIEFEFWKETSDSRVMPVTGRCIGYLVIFQVRGTAVTAHDLEMDNPFGSLSRDMQLDLQCDLPRNFARLDRPRLVDYGDRRSREVLRQSLV